VDEPVDNRDLQLSAAGRFRRPRLIAHRPSQLSTTCGNPPF
jgi:hypothetical protein